MKDKEKTKEQRFAVATLLPRLAASLLQEFNQKDLIVQALDKV